MNNFSRSLLNEGISLHKDCNLCRESTLGIGQKRDYGAAILFKIGNSTEDGWFATLSPKTGGDSKKDFTVQLIPFAHLTHFSQLDSYLGLAKNYGIAFSKISAAMTEVMARENQDFKATSETKESAISIATYGKCTTWKEKKEHLHIKIFPFRDSIGQPYTVDSSFERKKIQKDQKTGKEFVKMKPVRKVMLDKERFEQLSNLLISLLQ